MKEICMSDVYEIEESLWEILNWCRRHEEKEIARHVDAAIEQAIFLVARLVKETQP